MPRSLQLLLLAFLLAAAGLGAYVLGTRLAPRPELSGTGLDEPIDMSDVALVNEGLGEVEIGDLAGNVALVFFGFTRCPDVCPITMARLARAYEAAGEPDDLRVAMVTVDPEFDTPEVVERYADGFHPDFLGLSGPPSEVAAAARRFFIGFTQGAPEEVMHTDVVAVLDRRGRLVRIYGQDAVGRIEAELPELLARY